MTDGRLWRGFAAPFAIGKFDPMMKIVCRAAAVLGTLAIAACASTPPPPPAPNYPPPPGRHADAKTTLENHY